MKTVFIFGAGVSRGAKAPLMFDFLDCARALLRRSPDAIDRKAFERVFETLSQLRSVYARAYIDLDNIESVFAAIEAGELLGRFRSGRTHEQWWTIRS